MPTQNWLELYLLRLLYGNNEHQAKCVLDDDVEVLLDWDGVTNCWNALQALLLHYLSLTKLEGWSADDTSARRNKIRKFFAANQDLPLPMAVALDATRLTAARETPTTQLVFNFAGIDADMVREELDTNPNLGIARLVELCGGRRFHFFPPPNRPGLFEACCRLLPKPSDEDRVIILRRLLALPNLEQMPELAKAVVDNLILDCCAIYKKRTELRARERADLCRRFPLLVAAKLAGLRPDERLSPLVRLTYTLLRDLVPGSCESEQIINRLMSNEGRLLSSDGPGGWLVANWHLLLRHRPVWEVADWAAAGIKSFREAVSHGSRFEWPELRFRDEADRTFGLALLGSCLAEKTIYGPFRYGSWLDKYLGILDLRQGDPERFAWVIAHNLEHGRGGANFALLATGIEGLKPASLQEWLEVAPPERFPQRDVFSKNLLAEYVVAQNLSAGHFFAENHYQLIGAGYTPHEGELTKPVVKGILSTRAHQQDYYWSSDSLRESLLAFPGLWSEKAQWVLGRTKWHGGANRLQYFERILGSRLDEPQSDRDKYLRQGIVAIALQADNPHRGLALEIIASPERKQPWLTDMDRSHFASSLREFDKALVQGPTLLAFCSAESLLNRFFDHYLDKVLPDPTTLHWLLDNQKPRIAGLILAQASNKMLNPMMLQWVQEFDLVDNPRIARWLEQLKSSGNSSIAQLAVEILKAARAKRATATANITPEPAS